MLNIGAFGATTGATSSIGLSKTGLTLTLGANARSTPASTATAAQKAGATGTGNKTTAVLKTAMDRAKTVADSIAQTSSLVRSASSTAAKKSATGPTASQTAAFSVLVAAQKNCANVGGVWDPMTTTCGSAPVMGELNTATDGPNYLLYGAIGLAVVGAAWLLLRKKGR